MTRSLAEFSLPSTSRLPQQASCPSGIAAQSPLIVPAPQCARWPQPTAVRSSSHPPRVSQGPRPPHRRARLSVARSTRSTPRPYALPRRAAVPFGPVPVGLPGSRRRHAVHRLRVHTLGLAGRGVVDRIIGSPFSDFSRTRSNPLQGRFRGHLFRRLFTRGALFRVGRFRSFRHQNRVRTGSAHQL